MEDVSDPPFRALCKRHGADLMYTEFISSEGLIRDAAKSRRSWTSSPVSGRWASSCSAAPRRPWWRPHASPRPPVPELIDINYGCPVKKVVSKGAGACLLLDVDKMVRLTEAVVKAVKLPVTVKTRLGWDDASRNIEEVAERLQDIGIQAPSIFTRPSCTRGGRLDPVGKVKANPHPDPHLRQRRHRFPRRRRPTANATAWTASRSAARASGIRGSSTRSSTTSAPANTCPHPRSPTGWRRPASTCPVRWNGRGRHEGVVEMRRHYGNYFKGLPHFKEMRLRLCTEDDPARLFELLDEVRETLRLRGGGLKVAPAQRAQRYPGGQQPDGQHGTEDQHEVEASTFTG